MISNILFEPLVESQFHIQVWKQQWKKDRNHWSIAANEDVN